MHHGWCIKAGFVGHRKPKKHNSYRLLDTKRSSRGSTVCVLLPGAYVPPCMQKGGAKTPPLLLCHAPPRCRA
ncbi:hypothetical protein DXB99_08865 [Agathobacter rectalis]|uniref:Uncharacterized protein n=1 Tax=Agathobacter rectalis TaxID=39491 RepID=A0A3E4Y9T6_9FIRM|nr:hypothetical protein DXB99_08865 [Agathobacter rectalis]